MNLKTLTLLLGLTATQIVAQDLLGAPGTKWEQQLFGPSGNAQFSYGNGVFLTPDESEVVAVGTDGKVTAFAASDGAFSWDFEPPAVEEGSSYTIQSLSGMTFTTGNAASSYMIYSINYIAMADVVTDSDYTIVVALDMSGTQLSESPKLDGVHSGTPVISDFGSYVFLTHNSDGLTIGHFTILNESLELVVTLSNQDAAFAPIGIYHSPAEGFYDAIPGVADGTGNTNDMLMWSLTPSETGISVPSGLIYGFQFQEAFDGTNPDTLEYFALGGDRAFQTITPPVITNEGRSAYWSTSRSEYFLFVGKEDLLRAKYNRGPNIRENFETNAAWNGQPIWTVPAVSSAENGDDVIFGGTASTEFFRMNHRFDVDNDNIAVYNTTVVNTTSFVLASALVDPLKRAVYYVESDGKLHQVDFTTIEDIWSEEVTITNGVQGEMAINGDGSILYIVSTEGKISALSVAEPASDPTSAPTAPQPTAAPSTSGPTSVRPTATPTAPTTLFDGNDENDDTTPSASSAKSMLVAFVAVISSLFL